MTKTFSQTWLREPLTLFVVLGLALFVADRVLNGAPAPTSDNLSIVVTASQQATLRDAFRAENGRNPTAEELRTRLDRWVEEQVLYREALALNLDRKDPIVHRQLTQKMRFLLEDANVLPTPSDADLQAWFDQNMTRYGTPATVSFEQVFLSRGSRGTQLQADAAALSKTLAETPDAFAGLGDPFPLGQQVDHANAMQLRREFGADFAAALVRLNEGAWSAPITSGFGLHLVRVTHRSDFAPVPLASVRSQVLKDYQEAQRERLTQQAIENLKKKYRVRFEPLPP